MLDLYRLQSCSPLQLLAFYVILERLAVEKEIAVVEMRLEWAVLSLDEDDP
jgi:hypothetical protein